MKCWTVLRALFSSIMLRSGCVCLLAVCGPAQGETIDCTPITSLPTTITTQGIYCLTGNLNTNMTSGNAIEIQTNNITIDLNGFKLGGLPAGDATEVIGVHALARKNITLRNGTIRGFALGVWLEENSPGRETYGGHLLEDLRLDGNTYTALWVDGPGNSIRRNRIVDTGGSTLYTNAYGIQAYGPGARILGNDVDGTTSGTGGSYGIYVADADAAIIQGNRVTETTSAGEGDIYGIFRSGGTGLTIEANILSNVSATGTTGIYVNDAQSLCGNNRVRGFTTGISASCADAGGDFSL